MVRFGSRCTRVLCALTLAWGGCPQAVRAISLDQRGEMQLGVRSYTAARIGTEHLDHDDVGPKVSQSFPYSPAGHLRQHRFFVEAEFGHDLNRLRQEGIGPFRLLNDLPFGISMFRYKLVYRGEGEGIYDYGPREYRTADRFVKDLKPMFGIKPEILLLRQRLRRFGVQRHRLFQAFVDLQVADLFLRFGRQIVAWGETDAFRLLDNINPLDASFGGFLISLDERRVPLDMLRGNYYVGSLGPVSEAYVEGFIAVDDECGHAPAVPQGSPWGLQNDSTPNPALLKVHKRPAASLESARGGGLFKFNAPLPGLGEGTFSIAHYYTYLDTPRVQTFVRPTFPYGQRFEQPVPGRSQPMYYLVRAVQTAPRVQVTGAAATFVLPAHLARRIRLGGEPVFRTEMAYMKNQPRHTQFQLDPFVYANGGCAHGFRVAGKQGEECTGGRITGDSWNFAMGIDMNQYLRRLNPTNSFFLSTQFFYRHVSGTPKRKFDAGFNLTQREVLPVPEYLRGPGGAGAPAEQVFVRHPADQLLQTLMISTSYRSGTVNPNLTLFYDWTGTFVAVPAVTFVRDPFRFTVEYDYLEASRLKGASGTSLLRDRDNVLFQLEYVI